MIKKYSLLFQVLLFGKLLCFSNKNRFSFNDIIFLWMKLENNFFQIFLKEGGIKFVYCYGNANMKLITSQWTIIDELLQSHCWQSKHNLATKYHLWWLHLLLTRPVEPCNCMNLGVGVGWGVFAAMSVPRYSSNFLVLIDFLL